MGTNGGVGQGDVKSSQQKTKNMNKSSRIATHK